MGSIENPKKCVMLNDLPDDLLVHILSFLPTEEAFRTSILSSRWEKLWIVVPNLCFEPDKYISEEESPRYIEEESPRYIEEESPRYIDFIEMVFLSHTSKINKFHLKCTRENGISHRLKAWVSIVVEREVQDIDIFLDWRFELPQSLFTCKTLVSLKLISLDSNSLQLDHVPASIYLPCLKVLHVNLVSPSSVLTQNLFRSSPVLEDLFLKARHEDCGEFIYNICSPFLRKLLVKINTWNNNDFNCVVNVDAPILESLEVYQYPYIHFIGLENLSTLVKARLVSHEIIDEKSIKLLKSVSLVKELSLGGYLAEKVCETSAEMEWPVFPFVTHLTWDAMVIRDLRRLRNQNIFPNLIHLQLDLYGPYYFEYFLKILSRAPNLSTLLIKKRYVDSEVDNFAQAEVPRCLRSHVKEIELWEYKSIGELTLIKYLLESARELEKLTVTFRGTMKRDRLKKEIVMLPRSSKKCQLVFNYNL